MGGKSLSQYGNDCTLEACCCTTSPRSCFICLSMNILLRPRDVGQPRITGSLRGVPRPGALLISAPWSASELQEREETPVSEGRR